jgi:hypothetical protein
MVLVAGCEQGAAIGTSCTRASECASPLVCRLGRCRSECAADVDCPIAARCLRVSGAGSCSLIEETNCPAQPCPTGTVCLSGECATSCATDVDCPGGPCIDVTIGGATVRGCGDPRAPDAGILDGSTDALSTEDAGTSAHVIAIAAGTRTACALTAAHELWCWGGNVSGQLGDGLPLHDGECTDWAGVHSDHSVTPVRVAVNDVLGIALGLAHGCANIAGTSHLGEAVCWGDDGQGQLGHPGEISATPVAVVDDVGAHVTGVVGLAASQDSTIAWTDTGLLGWGDGHDGRIGTDTMSSFESIPLAAMLPPGVSFVDVAIGSSGVGLDQDHVVRTWGWNEEGTLGHGVDDAAAHVDFLPVEGVSGALGIAHGPAAACAWTASEVLCWGAPWTALGRDGDHSACRTSTGNGSSCARPVVGVSPTDAPVDVASSGTSTCVVLRSGNVHCTSAVSEHLGLRTDLPAMASLVAGNEFFCGISMDGRVICWGSGECGQTADASHPSDGAPHEVIIP